MLPIQYVEIAKMKIAAQSRQRVRRDICSAEKQNATRGLWSTYGPGKATAKTYTVRIYMYVGTNKIYSYLVL